MHGGPAVFAGAAAVTAGAAAVTAGAGAAIGDFIFPWTWQTGVVVPQPA